MKAYNKAVLEVEEFIPNADIAASEEIGSGSGVSGLSAGTEFEIAVNGNDEI